MVEDKEKALEKAKKKKLPSGVSAADKVRAIKERTQAITKAQEELDKWKAIAEVPAKQRAKVEEERIAKEKAEAEAKRKAEEETKRKAEAEAKRKAEEEKKRKAEEEKNNAEEGSEEIKPIGKGVFGNIYDQFKGKVKEAFAFLMKRKSGDLLGVFHREEFGDIDLVWGDYDGGLGHIIRRHMVEQNDFASVDEIQQIISEVIKNGRVVRENTDKINIEYDGYRVTIGKTIRDNKGIILRQKNWVITAFDKSKPKHEKRRTSSSETLTTPSANQKADGVTLPSNDSSSTDKDTDSSPSSQTNTQEKSTQSAVESAEAETETKPTESQKEAGNYKKGHVKVGKFDITIENPKGSERSGTDANGKKWSITMNNTYGYIRGTEGVDGDHIDVFLSNDMDKWDGKKVFVVDQYNPDGTFDEHKVMLGFNSAEEARNAYLSNYETLMTI